VKVVADTNVLVSALIFPGGAPEGFYRLGLEGRITLVTSPPLLAELGLVLTEKSGWQRDRADEALEQLIGLCEIVNPSDAVADIEADPADNRVLEAAAASNAAVIVSPDQHLLSLGVWRGIPIRGPAAFLTEPA
jgi:uncharacterized protein